MGRAPLLPLALAAGLWLLASSAVANESDPDLPPPAGAIDVAAEPPGHRSAATEPVEVEVPASAEEGPVRAAPDVSQGHVARAGFAPAMLDREPTGQLGSLPDGLEQVFFFSELVDLTGTRVIHRWEHEGRVVAEVPFEVAGPRWRVHSSKRLLPGGFGRWTVRVIDSEGTLLHHQSIAHESPAAEASGPGARPLPPASMLD